jgi:hypothetical protein
MNGQTRAVFSVTADDGRRWLINLDNVTAITYEPAGEGRFGPTLVALRFRMVGGYEHAFTGPQADVALAQLLTLLGVT